MTIAGLFDGVQNVNRRSIRRGVGIAAVAFTAPFFIAGAAGITDQLLPHPCRLALQRNIRQRRDADRVLSPGTVRELRRGSRISVTRKLPGWSQPAHETRSREAGRHRGCLQWESP